VVLDAAGTTAERLLPILQRWLGEPRLGAAVLLVATRRAVAVATDDDPDLATAPVWGLLRSAQVEHPSRFRAVDLDGPAGPEVWARVLASDEPQLAVRAGRLTAPRLVDAAPTADLAPPPDGPWSLRVDAPGTFDGLALAPAREGSRALAAGEVRIAVRAAGLNFRDVMGALGAYPGDPGPLGGEGAGVVVEVGDGVSGLRVGDRVMGMFPYAFGPLAVADHRTVARIPAGLSFVEAAGIPIVFLTAWRGLVDLGGLRAGERVLIHAAAGGVGMAAAQLARHLGAEVFGTASPSKWDRLRALGFDDAHLASSRDLSFEARFGRVDVVLDSLAGPFVDASLRLLGPGGRFVEMGKTDVRDEDAVRSARPGVTYRAFDLGDAGADRIGEMLEALVALFAAGALTPVPVRAWDVRRAPEAFRYMAQARHVGKIVLTVPRPVEPEGTVLITGGTGTLGALVAHHLVRRRRSRRR
jgi:NADPH:quinone reductase-like Zn-dependent oxidoreductase